MKTILFLSLLILSFSSHAVKNSQEGQNISSDLFNSSTLSIGSIQHSILSLSQFQAINGNCWRLMDGGSLSGTDLGTLLGASMPTIPNATDSGYFLRQASGGRALGSRQDDAFQDHRHTVPAGNGSFQAQSGGLSHIGTSLTSWVYADSGVKVATETRPKNIAVNLFIKVNRACSL